MSKPIKQVTIELHSDIRKDYERMSMPCSKYGVQKLTDKFIFCELAARYYKAPTTIEKIIYNRY
ncbi:hypothetical protein [Faecalibacter macacae]|uniref:Uncharacterized protein n=1 Tax=Faecalibacter macacae TaxID=1859289 RepID=A0A3L9M7R6_9FLAO|nr:hypothetical protein [Faecalibacter macacae]RLZ08583.1 hypothetical protein EAH69_09725 [Faecalibacter macacae]